MDVVVLGGGTGGLVAAHRLRRELPREDRVVLVERDVVYRFAPSFLWVLTGQRRPEQLSADLRRVTRRGIELVTADALGIDTHAGQVETSRGTIAYDRLVIALGAELAPEVVPGFAEAALTPYTLEGALECARALATFEGGRVAVLVSRLPYKCPAAPYETAFLTEAQLRKRGVRASVDVYSPEPYPMPTAGPVLGEALRGMLERRGIGFHPGRDIERIEADARELVFGDGEHVPFDLLLGVPPHRAPALVPSRHSRPTRASSRPTPAPSLPRWTVSSRSATSRRSRSPAGSFCRRPASSLTVKPRLLAAGSAPSAGAVPRAPSSMGRDPASSSSAMGSRPTRPATSTPGRGRVYDFAGRVAIGTRPRSRSRSTGCGAGSRSSAGVAARRAYWRTLGVR